MAAIAFDTPAFVKRLTGAGMPEAQAEVLTEEQVRLLDRQLATKADIGGIEVEIGRLREAVARDLKDLRGDMQDLREALGRDMQDLREAAARDVEGLRQEAKHDINELRADMRIDRRDLEHRLTLRTGTMLAAAVAIVTALVKLL